MASHPLPGYLRALGGLRGYFTQPMSATDARTLVRTRTQQRESLFLQMARAVFYRSGSPYRRLLDLAGIGFPDLQDLVRHEGLEGALRRLHRGGVYLSFEEYNTGEAVRGGQVIRFTAEALGGPGGAGGLSLRSGATRSAGRWVTLSIDNLAQQSAPQMAIVLEMLADQDAPVIIWQLGFPGGAAVANWFLLGKLRRPPRHWFSLTPLPQGLLGPGGYHRFFMQLARGQARRAGVHLPLPEYVPVGAVDRVLDALVTVLEDAGGGVVLTTPSCAVRLAAAAADRGQSLQGVGFLVGGEALTEAKAEEIRRAGARVLAQYASMEAGVMAAPCGHPDNVDDMHFRSDALAMITVPREVAGVTVETLMLTSLLPVAPRPFLNVEIDDFAVVNDRRCGCVWDELGCGPHLSGVRSFTKLTGEGTTLVGSNVVHIVEQVLPAAFGGVSTDYQLVEAEDEARLTRLFLVISPRVGPLDEGAVIRRFIEALRGTGGSGLGAGGGMRQVWEQADSIRILRREPFPTPVGKLLPFYTLGGSQRGRIVS